MSGWIEYGLAWAAFLGAHVISMTPMLRGRLIGRLGRRGYLTAFSIVSVGFLLWLIGASGRTEYIPLWESGNWGRWLVNLAMPLAILIGALGIGLSGVVAAFAIWSAAHLIANGDLAHVIFFGGMLIFALGGLARSGLPRAFRLQWWRWGLALVIWAGLFHLHPLITGLSPMP
jgi:uncharacterized membrane protein